MAGYIGSKAAVTQADGYTKTEADGRYVEGDDTLYVDQTNNRVGVGTTSPSNPITVDAANALGSTFTGTTAGEGIRVRQTSYTANNYVSLIEAPYVNTASQPAVRIGAKFSGSGSSLAFGTTNSYGSGITNTAMTIDSSGLLFSPPTYSNTSGGSSNVGIGASGEFYRSTSSRKYKNTINDATHGLAELLTLRPVTYKGNSDGDTIFGGLIAEEVHEAGLAEFVQYAEDGSPDALSYSNMVALCIKAIQEQQAKIETLETKVAALEAGE